MRNKLFLFSILAIAVLFLSGCAAENNKTDKINPSNQKSSDYLSTILDTKNDANKNIQNATEEENNKLNNALSENTMNTTQNTVENTSELVKKYSMAKIKTNLGDIEVKFYGDKTPMTVGNFLKLAQSGFYNGIKFHRVIKGFMIQGGDPNSKQSNVNNWGMGGPGYKFADELTGNEKYPQGALAMANAGPNTNGSQFFIVTANPEAPLPPSYTVFGEVINGMDVALKIENVETTTNDRPIENVIIENIELE